MKKLKLSRLGHLMSVLVALSYSASCINPEYDLGKVVMEEATLFEKIALPVGDVEKMTIEQVLFTNSEMPASIKKNQNGDMYIELFEDSFASSFHVPNSFNLNDMKLEESYIDLNTGALAGQSTSSLPETVISFSSLNGGKPFNLQMPLDVVADLPSEINDVRKVNLEAYMTCSLASSAPITIKNGFEIVFPDYIYVGKGDSSNNYLVTPDGHVVRFLLNTRVTDDNPLVLRLLLKQIDIPGGAVENIGGTKRINHKDNVSVTGDYSINTKDVSVVPDRVRLSVGVDMSNMTVKMAEVSLDVNMSIPEQEMEISELPDLLKGDDICVDLYNPQMSLQVSNNTPLSCTMTADLIASGAAGTQTELSITEEDGVTMPANTVRNFLLSRRKTTPATSATVNIVKPVIGDLIKNVPEKIRFTNCNISTSKDFVTISVGNGYSAFISYNVFSPLSFGEELALSFTQDIENLGLSLDVNVKSVVFEMNLINSIPIDFNLSAIALDEQGNEVSETKITLDKNVKAGSHVSPTTTPIRLEMKNSKGTLNVDALRLTMKATAPEADFVGVPLNVNQGFEIKDIVMSLPDGIGIEF